MKVKIEIDSENDDCLRREDVGRLIIEVGYKIKQGKDSGKIMDKNGNSVGFFTAER